MKYNDIFNSDTLVGILFTAAVLFLVFLIVFGFFNFLTDFRRDLRYINNEIGRSRGAEKKHWKREKRKLILSLLPFIRFK